MAPLIRVLGKGPRCYGCGGPFPRREWPVLDKLDRRWHLVCFLLDRNQDPSVPEEQRLDFEKRVVRARVRRALLA